MRDCSRCGRPGAGAVVESSHTTSEGLVRYRRCSCGGRWMELARFVITDRSAPTPRR